MIGQYNDRWKEDFFYDQMNLLRSSGLYDQCDFIDVYVKGNEPLPEKFDKFNNITYLGELEPEIETNRKLYRAYNYIQQKIWHFSNINKDYKVLFFHSLGVSHNQHPDVAKNKLRWRKYLENIVIDHWKECVDLLNFYDCVGTEFIPIGRYTQLTETIYAPHYQGFFWWANSNYLKKLDVFYPHQNVLYQPWLCELWIGSGNPNAYSFFNSNYNHYDQEIYPPYHSIINICQEHLKQLKYYD